MRCNCASQACTMRCGGVVGRSDERGGSATGHGTVEMRKKVDKRACGLQRVSTRLRCECGTVNHRRCRACDVVIGDIDIWTGLRPRWVSHQMEARALMNQYPRVWTASEAVLLCRNDSVHASVNYALPRLGVPTQTPCTWNIRARVPLSASQHSLARSRRKCTDSGAPLPGR